VARPKHYVQKLLAKSSPVKRIDAAVSGRKSLLATTVAALGNNVENQLARLLAALLCAHNLNGLVLRLVTRHLDLGASLLAEVVNCATTGADDEPVIC
jgi:hypothetical protein